MATVCRGFLIRHLSQTLDQGVNQLLFQPVCRRNIDKRPRAGFGCVDRRAMEVKQATQCRAWRSPVCERGEGDLLADYRVIIYRKLARRQPNSAPTTKTARSHIQA